MPFYTFEDKSTGEIFENSLKISELDEYLKNNPNLKQVLSTPNVVDPYRIGVTKNPNGYTDVLKNIQKHHPLGNIKV